MKPRALTATALTTTLALAFTGCENLTPGENAAVFGTGAAVMAGGIARASGMSTGESLATGAAVGAVVAATVYVIAKRQATERQRQIAEQRARAAYERRQSEIRRAQAANAKPRKRARYIAVDTARDERTTTKAKRNVMIWDTETQSIVGNNVYDIESVPQVGSTAKFETYSAEYVGGGS